MKSIIFWIGIAALFWFFMFSPWTSGSINFWAFMGVGAGILGGAGLWLQRESLSRIYFFRPRFVIVGIVAAFVLYAIFFVAGIVSMRLFEFAKPDIGRVLTRSKSWIRRCK